MPSLTLSRARRPRPVMNVTPLVDVVLVLLIIFMVIVPMMEGGATVELPGLVHVDEEAKSKTDPFTLAITADGSMYFEREKLAPEALRARLREANLREPSRRLILRGDVSTRYADVRKLFAICQSIGFPGISLRANQRESGVAAKAGAAKSGATDPKKKDR